MGLKARGAAATGVVRMLLIPTPSFNSFDVSGGVIARCPPQKGRGTLPLDVSIVSSAGAKARGKTVQSFARAASLASLHGVNALPLMS